MQSNSASQLKNDPSIRQQRHIKQQPHKGKNFTVSAPVFKYGKLICFLPLFYRPKTPNISAVTANETVVDSESNLLIKNEPCDLLQLNQNDRH